MISFAGKLRCVFFVKFHSIQVLVDTEEFSGKPSRDSIFP